MISAGNVTPFVSPDRTAMREHLEHLFGGFLDGYHDGKIEIAWTDATPDASGKHKLRHAEYFGTDELDEAADRAAQLNSTPMVNVYVGAALRNPDSAPFGRSSDADAWALTALYVDLDDPGTATAAKDTYGITRPTFVCVTGREPHTRAQLWWRLDEPLTDPDQWRAMLDGMAATLGGDTTVTNAGRVMRLAGSVAWPVKEGRVVELTTYIRPQGAAQSYPAETVQRALCRDLTKSAQKTASFVPQPSTTTTGLFGHTIQDGRERYMRQTIAAVLLEYIGTTGTDPTPQELFDAAWPQYERGVDLSRPGRGPAEFAEKCEYAVKRFHAGKIAGMRDLDEAVATYTAKVKSRVTDYRKKSDQSGPEQKPHEPGPGPILASTLTGDPPERQWIVDQWIPAGVVTALYGDGGIGKTLLAQQLLYSASIGGEWVGLPVPQMAGLGVFCEDDENELHRRQNAIKSAMGYSIGNPFTNVWLWPRVGSDNILVTFNKDNLPTTSPFFDEIIKEVLDKRIGLLVLDTVADLFGGNEIIRAQVNYFIKSVCGAVIKRAKEAGFTLTVVILAHPSQTGRNTGTGESGSTAWNNAVRSRLYLKRDDMAGSDARILTRMKSNYSASGDDQALLLKWEAGAIVRRNDSDGSWMPPREECQKILAKLDRHWQGKGRDIPVLTSRKEAGTERYAADHIAKEFAVTKAQAERLVKEWLQNGVLELAVYNTDTKAKGLRVKKGI